MLQEFELEGLPADRLAVCFVADDVKGFDSALDWHSMASLGEEVVCLLEVGFGEVEFELAGFFGDLGDLVNVDERSKEDFLVEVTVRHTDELHV